MTLAPNETPRLLGARSRGFNRARRPASDGGILTQGAFDRGVWQVPAR
jgi:hypothetical protein